MSDTSSSMGLVVGVAIGLLIFSAVSAVVIHFALEKRQENMRQTLEQQLLRYTSIPSDTRQDIPINEVIDGSGIPKVRSVDNKIVMLAYGYQFSSPAAAELRLSSQVQTMSDYAAEVLQRPEDEREWYRNVALVVILEKILAKQSAQVLGLLNEVTRELAGSVGIKKTISDVLTMDRLSDEESSVAIAKILNEELTTGQPRTKYIVARALGLLMREPKKSEKPGPQMKEQAVLYAKLINADALLTCLFVYPTVYEVYERVIQLRAPPESRMPGTREVVDHLVNSDHAHVYLTFILHIKKLPHRPFVPRELVVKLMVLAKSSPFHASIVDEILATNLKSILSGSARLENAPLVCLVEDIAAVMTNPGNVLPDTYKTSNDHKNGLDNHRALITERSMLDWMEGQVALYNKLCAGR